MAFGPIVSGGWLAGHLDHEGLVPVDCRWYLGEPERGPAEYDRSHIRGAIYMDLDADLSSPAGPGRHPLPSAADFSATLGEKGISPDSALVAYDDRGGAVAARLWWMLRDLGHERVAVLDGGLAGWPQELMDAADVNLPPTNYSGAAGNMPRTDRSSLATRLRSVVAIDARAAERYRGAVEPVDPIAGHIPGAISAPLTDNLDAHMRFKSPSELALRFEALGVAADSAVVSYCGSGVTACHNILAMELAGLPPAMLYPGSWSDWATAGMPVAVGAETG